MEDVKESEKDSLIKGSQIGDDNVDDGDQMAKNLEAGNRSERAQSERALSQRGHKSDENQSLKSGKTNKSEKL